ncbi:MAG: diguanylate cyclase [Nanoarchaeota archaeon]|nr:diguanylate cyclase [Nanoarchaeota archaeon]MBU1030089.1 diguanylate cyclase [Nanoarchaeota archaeon]
MFNTTDELTNLLDSQNPASGTPKDKNILIVDDDKKITSLIKYALCQIPYFSVSEAYSGEEGLEHIKSVYHDLALIDINLSGMSGLELLKKIKEESKDTMSIVMTGNPNLETAVEAMKIGACDYLSKPLNLSMLMLKVQKELRNQENAVLSERDPKTGLYNMGAFQSHSLLEIKRLVRSRKPLSLVFFDVDNFKKYNDTFGHLEGDYVLKKIARNLMESTRLTDLAVRFGGEEMVLLLPETTFDAAYNLADRLRERISSAPYSPKKDFIKSVTVSGGVATYNPPSKGDFNISINQIVKAADDALYKAKLAGKNQIWEENLLES